MTLVEVIFAAISAVAACIAARAALSALAPARGAVRAGRDAVREAERSRRDAAREWKRERLDRIGLLVEDLFWQTHQGLPAPPISRETRAGLNHLAQTLGAMGAELPATDTLADAGAVTSRIRPPVAPDALARGR